MKIQIHQKPPPGAISAPLYKAVRSTTAYKLRRQKAVQGSLVAIPDTLFGSQV